MSVRRSAHGITASISARKRSRRVTFPLCCQAKSANVRWSLIPVAPLGLRRHPTRLTQRQYTTFALLVQRFPSGSRQGVLTAARWHTWLVSTLVEKRTQRGHSGQSTDRSAAGGSKSLRGQPKAIAFTKHTRRKGPGASALPRPAAERSVLCPLCPRFVRFFMSLETSYAPSPAHRCLGLDRCERRCRPRPVQSIISDAIH